MNGAHDLGGMDGFGPVDPDPNQPVFHDEWERRMFALTVATGFLGRWNIDMSRHARERMDPADYLATSYYEHWLHGLETLLVERDLVTAGELAAGQALQGNAQVAMLKAADVEQTLRKGSSARLPDKVAPKFKAGQRIVVRNLNPLGHTRVPRYIRGRTGIIDRDHGVFVFPDTNADETSQSPQHVYSVRFEGREVWGAQAAGKEAIYIDLWDDYMDPA